MLCQVLTHRTDLLKVIFLNYAILFQDLFVPPSGKRKRDDSSTQYQNGRSIPQQDGASDDMPQVTIHFHLHLKYSSLEKKRLSLSPFIYLIKISFMDAYQKITRMHLHKFMKSQ